VFVSQSAELAPADKKLYELRDVTGTVESIPLIASSIMSKKIAEGTDALVLDVKVGAGGFMKTLPDATALAETMVSIGTRVSLRTEALLTSMDAPLGHCIGNALEIRECIDTLYGQGPADLERLCTALASRMLCAGGVAQTLERGEALVRDALQSGRAAERFRQVVERQGGDPRVVADPDRLPRARTVETFVADRPGFVRQVRADRVGLASMLLGAGRDRLDAEIDPAAGIVLRAAPGDRVDRGDAIADLHSGGGARVTEARSIFASAVVIGDDPPVAQPTVMGVVS
jgi:pyrimidine-nucleoside phosphorylase